MKVLIKKEWIDIPLDYAICSSEARVSIQFMVNIERIHDVYFQRERDFRVVWNYIREIGPLNTLTKIISRSDEVRRNEKYLSAGYGHIETPQGKQPVFFVAPLHPACLDMIACSKTLLNFTDDNLGLPPNQLHYCSLDDNPFCETLATACKEAVGRSHHSDDQPLNLNWDIIVSELKAILKTAHQQVFPAPARRAVTTAPSATQDLQQISASLFGYGNYAKTVILPNLPTGIKITRIHEIDPLQLSDNTHKKYTCSTEPELSEDDKSSVLFIAGYHHTHAGIANDGLRRNLDVVVEKPLVTTRTQLEALQIVYSSSKGRYFSCFHKRYLRFNKRVRSDLGIGPDEPINYHALVYEVPLPKRHWYRWANSGSRIVSNGCHWMDHFLFLNNFRRVINYAANAGPNGMINVSVTLDNGAYFTMVLTDSGSERLGVQDYIQLRQNHRTIQLINGARYQAENKHRILCRLSTNRMESYSNMYHSIGDRICRSEPGETWDSISISADLTLNIEQLMVES